MKYGKGWKRHERRKRYPGRNRHHLVPKSRGGSNSLANILLLDIDRHMYWHKLFNLMTLEEVLELLQRVARMKARQRWAA